MLWYGMIWYGMRDRYSGTAVGAKRNENMRTPNTLESPGRYQWEHNHETQEKHYIMNSTLSSTRSKVRDSMISGQAITAAVLALATASCIKSARAG